VSGMGCPWLVAEAFGELPLRGRLPMVRQLCIQPAPSDAMRCASLAWACPAGVESLMLGAAAWGLTDGSGGSLMAYWGTLWYVVLAPCDVRPHVCN